jgi:thiol-disulfide isomerase/thioredoxin
MLPLLLFYVSLVNDVRVSIAKHDLAGAERLARAYEARAGQTPELAAALSWVARGALNDRHYGPADAWASEARKIADELLRTRKLDGDPWLPTAVGAVIEVHAQVMAARGERAEAVSYLREQLKLFAGTSINERIQKNINLLSLEGKPAPQLDEADWIGAKPPSLDQFRGRPVLLFFWAHWCSDCKAEVAIVADLQKTYKSLALVGPTRLYGYAAKGEPAPPAQEKRYIEQVRRQYYSTLGDFPAPLSSANFHNYGCSSTPTLVLLDAAGIVRLYHPGAMSKAELSAKIETVLQK